MVLVVLQAIFVLTFRNVAVINLVSLLLYVK